MSGLCKTNTSMTKREGGLVRHVYAVRRMRIGVRKIYSADGGDGARYVVGLG